MNPLIKFLEDHHEVIAGFLYFWFMAEIVTMPPNWDGGLWKTLWKWQYDAAQEFISMRSGKLVSGPAPKPAVEVPKPIDAPSTQTGESK